MPINKNLGKRTSISLPIGHLLVIWDILANKLAGEPLSNEFSDEEKRAIWSLQDLCEEELINNGFTEKPKEEWDELMQQATEFVKYIPADFLD